MGKLSNSADLAKASLAVLNKDRVLAVIPLVSSASCGLVMLIFGAGAVVATDRAKDPASGTTVFSPTPATWAIGIMGLLLVGFIAQFFTAALIAGANERLEGGTPTIGSAFSKASSRIGSILGWAVVNATVGMILQAIRQRAGILGVAASWLAGAAWTVITWLAVPIIIVEGVGPIDAIKRSSHLLKQTWGENVIAQVGLGAVGVVALLPGMIVAGAAWLVSPAVSIALFLLWAVIVGTVMSALGAIYRTALYRFAVGLPAGDGFSQERRSNTLMPRVSSPCVSISTCMCLVCIAFGKATATTPSTSLRWKPSMPYIFDVAATPKGITWRKKWYEVDSSVSGPKSSVGE